MISRDAWVTWQISPLKKSVGHPGMWLTARNRFSSGSEHRFNSCCRDSLRPECTLLTGLCGYLSSFNSSVKKHFYCSPCGWNLSQLGVTKKWRNDRHTYGKAGVRCHVLWWNCTINPEPQCFNCLQYSGRSWLALAGGSLGEQAQAVSTGRRKLWSLGFTHISAFALGPCKGFASPLSLIWGKSFASFSQLWGLGPWLAVHVSNSTYSLRTSSTPNTAGLPGFLHVSMETFRSTHILHDQKEILTITSSKGPIF